MIYALVILSLVALPAAALLSLSDSQKGLRRLFQSLHNERGTAKEEFRRVPDDPLTMPCSDPFPELSFTRSLLALSKVRLLAPGGSPEPAPVEPSSSASVPHAQLRNHDRAL